MKSRIDHLIFAILFLSTLLCFWGVSGNSFVVYDDDVYVTSNPSVLKGIKAESLIWAFTTFHGANWHPLTWISHMLDCQLFGLNPAGHHLISLLLHIVNVLLLFYLLKRTTGLAWPSALAAVLFAIHPLRVESVAWIAERKDVLSTVFFLLTIYAYTNYLQVRAGRWYLGSIFFFALGLMSKPMLVSLPFVLLLLDFWPLCRFGPGVSTHSDCNQYRPVSLKKALLEKAPFFFLSLISSVITLLAQQLGKAVISFEDVPFHIRIANSIVSYVAYLGKLAWPDKLAVIYPLSVTFSYAKLSLDFALLLIITLAVVRNAKKYPFLFAGWFWYLITLIPVIGIVQVGYQAMADRYSYVPSMGICLMIGFGWPELLRKLHIKKQVGILAATCIVCLLMACTVVQVRHWNNFFSLFTHAAKVTSDNYIAHYNLAIAMQQQGFTDKAEAHFSEVLRIKPFHAGANNGLGMVLLKNGKLDAAYERFLIASRQNYPEAYNNLGIVCERQNRLNQALSYFMAAVKLKPEFPKCLYNIAVIFMKKKNYQGAVPFFYKALEISPNCPEAHNNIGVAFLEQNQPAKAIRHFQQALALKPDYAEAHNNLGVVLLRQGYGKDASLHFSAALQSNPNYPEAANNLKLAQKALKSL